MPSFNDIPPKYREFSEQGTKNLSIIVEIEGVPDVISSTGVYTRVRYGDGTVYGEPGIVYGGLRPYVNPDGSSFKQLLSLDGSSLTLSQVLEPEQGRSSVSQITLAFVDVDEYMTQLCSPGVIIDEILGRKVKVWLGYTDISYPEDFLLVFQGRVTSTKASAGRVVMELSDPNSVRRQYVFYTAKTETTLAVTNVQTTIPVASTEDFHFPIIGPDGNYDPGVTCYIQIEDEVIQIHPTDNNATSFGSVIRGARGTTAAAHDSGSTVEARIELEDNAVTMALKLMLSGWNGPYQTGVAIAALAYTSDPDLGTQPTAIVLPDGVDALLDLGLATGDYITITGDTFPANNTTVIVSAFGNANGFPNKVIYTDTTFTTSMASPATLALRSQFDTYPLTCGLKMYGDDVDVQRFIDRRDNFGAQETMNFYLRSQERGKEFIDGQLMLPIGFYTLTRNGRVSCGVTVPPIADDRLVVLNSDNVINPNTITPVRATNNRKFFNEIDWQYDPDDEGNFQRTLRQLDSESISLIRFISVLPIDSRGTRASLSGDLFDQRGRFLLGRYKRGAIQYNVKTFFGIGSQMQAGDVIALEDDGTLKIHNFQNGTRNLGTNLYELVGWSLDLKTGNCDLTLLAGLNFSVTDKFATWSPSSYTAVGSSTTRIVLQDSFGAKYPGNEGRKWFDYEGLLIRVRNADYTVDEQVTLTQIDPGNPNALIISPALPFTPGNADYIVELVDYPNNTDSDDQKLVKLVHVYWTKQVSVATGISGTQFTVAPGDVQYFEVGYPVSVHTPNWSSFYDPNNDGVPEDTLITDVTGTTITVADDLGFTPNSTYRVDLLKFPDGGFPYRWV